MAPKTKITGEMITNRAFELIRQRGYGSLNARSLASFLSSSTQPILYHFSSMEEVRDKAYETADSFHTSYLLCGLEEEEDTLLALGLRYVRFAFEERNLFLFLFQSGHFGGDVSELLDDNALNPILEGIMSEMNLEREDAKSVFLPLFVASHGYASLIANNRLRYDEEEIKRILKKVFYGALSEGGENRE